MDDDVRRTLDTQRRRLDDLDRAAQALLTDPETELDVDLDGSPVGNEAPGRSFGDVVAVNDILRVERGWEQLLLPPEGGRARREWSTADLAVVGLAGVTGVVAAWHEEKIDERVRDLLEPLSETPFFENLEKAAKNGVIDYQKHGFGGPHHRARNPAHDVARFVETILQLLKGEFRGIDLGNTARVFRDAEAATPVATVVEAAVLLCRHLLSDVVTPTSLPLPGSSLLDELFGVAGRDLNRLLYQGERGKITGLTLRSGMLHLLPLLCTELLVGVHLRLRAHAERGTWELTGQETALRSEMLLVAHGLTGAASLGRTLTTAMFGDLTHRVLSVRHLNVPVLLRLGILGVSVARARNDPLPDWDRLAERLEAPWDLPLANDIEATVAATL